MSQPKAKNPSINGSEIAIPSPAREALKSNLEPSGDSLLPLGKKRSWFGSLRDAVHKGAMQAKAAVDTFRGDPPKAESTEDATEIQASEASSRYRDRYESPPRKSMDSVTQSLVSSTTPIRRNNDRRDKLMSKVATASLRQHLSHPSRDKRVSVYSMNGRPSSEMTNPAGPEHFTSLSSQDDIEINNRKSSVTSSIVGSIRGLGRKTGKVKPIQMTTKETLPEPTAAVVPLPSSPIDIPAAAPSLDLDLGPAGLMTPMFGRSPEKTHKERAEELRKLTDPANITTGIPMPTPILVPGNTPLQIKRSSIFRPVTPRDLLRIVIENDGPSLPPPGPATPMPGTSFALELDGASSEKSDKCHVFERSVTPSFKQEQRELRKMQSLDAMAEACTVAHANDEIVQVAELDAVETEHRLASPVEKPNPRPASPRRDFASSETIQTLQSCPSDMPELTRQRTPHEIYRPATRPIDDARSVGQSVYEDPFDDRNAIKSASGTPTPSPCRPVKLPFRPKPLPEVEDGCADCGREDGLGPKREPVVERHLSGLACQSPQPADNICMNKQAQHYEEVHDSSVEADPFQTIAIDDGTQTRAQQPLISDIKLPDCDHLDHTASDGLPLCTGPLAQRALHQTKDDQDCQSYNPGRTRSRASYVTSPQETEHKFSFDAWLRGSPTLPVPESEPSTPHRRRMEMSLDSVSTNEDKKPAQTSLTTTQFERTPSMGNKLTFELKRSERNSRYNALHQDFPREIRHIATQSRRAPPHFIFGGSDESEAPITQLADSRSSYSRFREATPHKQVKALQNRVASKDSVAESLKNAAFDYYQLEERLADAPHSDDRNVFADFEEPYKFMTPPGTPDRTRNQIGNDLAASVDDKSRALQMLTVQSSSLPTYPHLINEIDPFDSSPVDSPSTIIEQPHKNSVTSLDTLDQTLDLFGSPESGYQADESSAYLSSASISKAKPSRYQSKGKRGCRVLSETPNNIG